MKLSIFCRCSLFLSWSGKRLISTPVKVKPNMSLWTPPQREKVGRGITPLILNFDS